MTRKKMKCSGYLLATCVAAVSARAEEVIPFTRLFDTSIASVQPLSDEAIAKRTGWTLVPEDKVDHPFSGDAVLVNDKLAVVLRKQGRGAEVYSRAANGLKNRATVGHIGAGLTFADSISALKIVENNSSAVMVQAAGKDKAAALSFRLTTGESILEIRPDEQANPVEVLTESRYVVVPDYFGDDMVFDAPSPRPSPPVGERETDGQLRRTEYLPAENFLLNLLDDGNAMMMTVWASREQDARFISTTPLTNSLSPAEGERAGVRGTAPDKSGETCSLQIGCIRGKSVWLALLESSGLWHASSASAEDDWKPPFPAKWRYSVLHGSGVADSWTLEQGVVAEPGRDGFHSVPDFKREDGDAVERVPTGPLIVYPIDRSAATPLTVTCPTDVMRNTLGVGPCQYILACEGLAAQGDPTPNAVMNWVEKQFEQKKQRKAADDIKERLDVMTQHIAEARSRIQNYREFAGQMRKRLANRPGTEPFLQIVDDVDRFVAAGLDPAASPERGRQLATQVSALIDQENAFDACQRLGDQLRALGAVQDRTLAKCRMAVRRLRAESKTVLANQSPTSGLAQEVQRMAEQQLQKK
ncbi:MAG TPA: hypothetical protein PK640_08355 [Verrucomicrobiota bacterium]|nr:hypothetical protein [Verrucomicrobiota bacterium]